eukprot:CAMPEP_0114538816 /NCGR_PEP_ID=MMETSP0109-20121206/30352_1 /TAXON_ID=29199 /ORGANISM="Chlorarachnion reptans, Strain CCCM449" /LENGTH=445 /DNA_ID=CAMNT_0001722875 /DNA_START=2309 /DNA_END=3643 /DNA_ORIENTATION=-
MNCIGIIHLHLAGRTNLVALVLAVAAAADPGGCARRSARRSRALRIVRPPRPPVVVHQRDLEREEAPRRPLVLPVQRALPDGEVLRRARAGPVEQAVVEEPQADVHAQGGGPAAAEGAEQPRGEAEPGPPVVVRVQRGGERARERGRGGGDQADPGHPLEEVVRVAAPRPEPVLRAVERPVPEDGEPERLGLGGRQRRVPAPPLRIVEVRQLLEVGQVLERPGQRPGGVPEELQGAEPLLPVEEGQRQRADEERAVCGALLQRVVLDLVPPQRGRHVLLPAHLGVLVAREVLLEHVGEVGLLPEQEQRPGRHPQPVEEVAGRDGHPPRPPARPDLRRQHVSVQPHQQQPRGPADVDVGQPAVNIRGNLDDGDEEQQLGRRVEQHEPQRVVSRPAAEVQEQGRQVRDRPLNGVKVGADLKAFRKAVEKVIVPRAAAGAESREVRAA